MYSKSKFHLITDQLMEGGKEGGTSEFYLITDQLMDERTSKFHLITDQLMDERTGKFYLITDRLMEGGGGNKNAGRSHFGLKKSAGIAFFP
jgi:hypothetical protein